MVVDQAFARAFATEWVDAWNAHDLERIFSHYRDDFTMTSPLIVERMNEPSGVLHGKAAVRPYWARGLAVTPPIRFELLDVYCGCDGIVIHYRSIGRRLVTEVIAFDDERRVVRAAAYYGGPASP